jgi:phosphate transport system substrate-binding protein
MRYSWLAAGAAAVLALGVTACGSSSSDSGGSGSGGSITGAGATFPAPFYSELASQVKSKDDLTVNYNAVGSGAGLAQFTQKTVDFGASDPSLKPEELAAAKTAGGTDVVQVPTVLGAITISYNVSGVETGLKLDGATIADIFSGKITKWNDAKIASLNSGVNLPSTDITTCHRSDSSGTTKNFTTYVAIYDSTWEKEIGVDKTVKWPGGTGAKGNDGVAACVKQNDGGVGYVEQAYALQNKFNTAAVKNKSGAYVEPTLASTSAAADGVEVAADNTFKPLDSPNAKAYPITATTYLLMWQDACKAGQSKDTAKAQQTFASFALGEGQSIAQQLEYAPLPSNIQSQAQKSVDGLQCNGSAL